MALKSHLTTSGNFYPLRIYFLVLLDNGEMMKRSLVFLLVVLCFAVVASYGQAAGIVKKDLSQAEIDRIIKKVTENESDFRVALTSYVFSRLASISTIGMGGQITGTYRRDSFMTFTQRRAV